MRFWLTAAAIVVVLPIMFWIFGAVVLTDPQESGKALEKLKKMSESELQLEKAREEVLALNFRNRANQSFWPFLLSNAAAVGATLTAAAAAAGFIITIWRQLNQRDKERREATEQKERDLKQLQREMEQKAEEGFSTAMAELGAESGAIRAGAAVMLLTFLEENHSRFHNRVFLILQANLKLQHNMPNEPNQRTLNDILIRGFEDATRKYIRLNRDRLPTKEYAHKQKFERYGLDFVRTQLDRINLSDIDNLVRADLSFASLRNADLSNTNLFRCRGYRVDLSGARLTGSDLEEARLQHARCNGTSFHKSRLVAADLKYSILDGAQFFQTHLQSAHLEHASLRGANFRGANLNDAYFFNCRDFDRTTLNSITRAKNWRKAHFDDAVRDDLERISSSEEP